MAAGDQGPMLQLLDAAYVQVLNGFGVFSSAQTMAQEYLEKNGGDPKRAADDLIAWQMTKAATAGFVTNIAGAAALPVALPANITSVIYIQLRMIAAVAILGGYDVHSDKVRTLIYASLLGAGAADLLKDAGIKLGERVTAAAIAGLTGLVARKMATSAAARLLAKLGLSSASNFARLVPIAGGVVAASVDAASTKAVGAVAVKIFLASETAAQPAVS